MCLKRRSSVDEVMFLFFTIIFHTIPLFSVHPSRMSGAFAISALFIRGFLTRGVAKPSCPDPTWDTHRVTVG